MARKLTISIDDEVYEGLYRHIGKRRIGQFLEALARPHVIDADLEAGYQAMAADEEREAEAAAWSEITVVDVADEPR
jgi:hypothetical protein